MKIKAAVLNEIKTPYILEELNLSDIREDEVLVKMVASGICHSNIVFGHESAQIDVAIVHYLYKL